MVDRTRGSGVGPLLDLRADAAPTAVIDFETTGLRPEAGDRVVEVAIMRLEPRQPDAEAIRFEALVNPGCPMPESARAVHGIGDEMLLAKPAFGDLIDQILPLIDGAVIVAHSAEFDLSFLASELSRAGVGHWRPGPVVCTLSLARHVFGLPQCSLAALAERTAVPQPLAHRAMADVGTALGVYRAMLRAAGRVRMPTVRELIQQSHDLRKGGPKRREIVRSVVKAAKAGEVITIDYISRMGIGPLIIRRDIEVHKVRLPYIEAFCHLRNEDRVFRVERILRILPKDEPRGA